MSRVDHDAVSGSAIGKIVRLPSHSATEAAWERYALLVNAMRDDLALRADRRHCEAVVRAHKVFADLFTAIPAAR